MRKKNLIYCQSIVMQIRSENENILLRNVIYTLIELKLISNPKQPIAIPFSAASHIIK